MSRWPGTVAASYHVSLRSAEPSLRRKVDFCVNVTVLNHFPEYRSRIAVISWSALIMDDLAAGADVLPTLTCLAHPSASMQPANKRKERMVERKPSNVRRARD